MKWFYIIAAGCQLVMFMNPENPYRRLYSDNQKTVKDNIKAINVVTQQIALVVNHKINY